MIGLDDSLQYNDLVIEQGSGSNTGDVIVRSGAEYLAILAGIDVANINYFDFVSMAEGSQTLVGSNQDDVFLGASGVDTITTGDGEDIVLAYGGNDTINIDGTGNKTINGGSGTDQVTISLPGHDGFEDFVISKSGDDLQLISQTGDQITLISIEQVAFGDKLFEYISRSSSGYTENAFVDYTNQVIYSVDDEDWDSGHSSFGSWEISNFGFDQSNSVTVNGSNNDQIIFLGGTRKDFTGEYIVNLGGGEDRLILVPKNTDSIQLGSGDDYLRIEIWESQFGTPNFASFSPILMDGGAGIDTLSFMESRTDGAELALTTGGATNFENLEGTLYRTTGIGDTLRGDSASNTLSGLTGSDIIYGGSGDDVLYGDSVVSLDLNAYGISRIYEASDNSSEPDDDNLYGEAGNDILVGTAGNNILDGGTGADTIVTGDGMDTIIIRAGDGGVSAYLADTITDFEDGTDVIGMDDGLLFTDLSIAQGTGNYANDTLVSITSTGEYLAVVEGINATALTEVDFTPVDIL